MMDGELLNASHVLKSVFCVSGVWGRGLGVEWGLHLYD